MSYTNQFIIDRSQDSRIHGITTQLKQLQNSMVIKTISFKGYGIQQRIVTPKGEEPGGEQDTAYAQFLVLGEDGNPNATAVKPILDALAGKNVKYLEYSFETIGYPDSSSGKKTPPVSHTVRCYPVGYTSTNDVANTENPVSPSWMFMLPNNASMATNDADTKFYSNFQTLTLTPSGASFTLGGGLPMLEAMGKFINLSGEKEAVGPEEIKAEQANSCMFFPAGTIMYNKFETPIPWTLSFMIYYQ